MVDRARLTLLAAGLAFLAARLFGYLAGVGGVERHHVESAAYIFAAAAACAALARNHGAVRAAPAGAGSWGGPLGLFVAASLLLYGSSLGLGFLSDDFVLVERAREGRWLGGWEFVRPLPAAAWTIVLAAGGGARAIHFLSVALHGVNATLVARLSERHGFSRREALACGALFLAFPSSVEAVAWPAASSDLIVTSATLGFLLNTGRRPTAGNTAAALTLLAAGLLSKESAVVMPAIGLITWGALPAVRRTPGLTTILIGLAMGAAYAVARAALVPISDAYLQPPTRYMLKELLAQPVAALTLPWSESILRSYWWLGFAGAFAVMAAVAGYAWTPDRLSPRSLVVRCFACAIVSVLPVYSLLFISPDLQNARYVYLPTAFWVIGLVAMTRVQPGPAGRTLRATVGAGAIAAGAVGVQWHLGAWKDAAITRDAVLGAARIAVESSRCGTTAFAAVPDNVRGAYVFRNGLDEAVSASVRPGPARGDAVCRWTWDGAAFRLDAPPPAPTTPP